MHLRYSMTIGATVAFTVALSVLVHGIAATPVMRRLEDSRA